MKKISSKYYKINFSLFCSFQYFFKGNEAIITWKQNKDNIYGGIVWAYYPKSSFTQKTWDLKEELSLGDVRLKFNVFII